MAAYQWKAGSRIRADAQASAEQFEQLASTPQGLTAQTLLDASRPESAPLHDENEWCDEKAANEWRLHQSRHFINSLVLIREVSNESAPVASRAFCIANEASKYEPILKIMQDTQKRASLLSAALHELKAFKQKYRQLSELRTVFEAAEEIEKQESKEETK